VRGETLVELLRSPSEVARRCAEEDRLPELSGISLLAIFAGAAAFGGVLGSFRGEAQILFAGGKLPVAMLATLAVCVPAFGGLAAALGRPWPLRRIVALVLAAAARAALLLLALAPVLWLAVDWGLSYHRTAVLAACVYGAAGLAALGILLRGLGPGEGRVITAVAFVAVFLAVGGQTAWILRPYLGRPALGSVPLLREREGSFADAVVMSARSSVGIFDSDPEVPSMEAAWDVPARAERHRTRLGTRTPADVQLRRAAPAAEVEGR